MKNYITFVKKEFYENFKNYKLFILLAVFFLFGIMNPLFAKFTPEIISLALPEGVPEELKTLIAEPTALDSWMQFYKNVTQMGMIVLVILFSTIISSELTKGTLVNLLTKGLSRSSVIYAKYTYMSLAWTINLLISYVVTYGYTRYFFPSDTLHHLFAAVLYVWFFGLFIWSVMLLAGVITKAASGSLLVTAGVLVLGMVLNMIYGIWRYNPLSLASKNLDIIQENINKSELYPALLITCILSVVCVVGASVVFKKKEV